MDISKLLSEVKYKFSRSGGRGGQNVNKVSTKAELVFNIGNSLVLDSESKNLLRKKLANKIDSNDNIRIFSQTERSQLANRKKCNDKFIRLIGNALRTEKVRIKTSVSRAVKENILEEKRKHALKKQNRKKPDISEEELIHYIS
jgi:ribosome-associated protein